MRTYKLKELLSIKNGKDHKELKNGAIPIFGSGGIMRFGDKAIYNDESILLPRKGTLSNIQYVNKPFWTVDTIYYTIVNKGLANPFYLYNFIKSLDLSKLNTGTGVPSMTFDSYYNLDIILPELEVQHKIASVLSALNSKIELNNRINTDLEAMAKTLYDYWFVQFDFPDKNGKPYKSSGGKMVWNEELKREIPEGWEFLNLSDIAEIIMGQSPEGETYNSDGNGMIFYQGRTDFGFRYPAITTFTTSPKKKALKNDILMSVRAPVGDLNIAIENCSIGRGVAALRSKNKSNSTLFYTLKLLKSYFEWPNTKEVYFLDDFLVFLLRLLLR